MRVLVTGGLGVVGSQFALAMLKEGHSVTIIDAAESRRNEWVWQQFRTYGDRVRLCRRRLEGMSVRELSEYFKSCRLILHAAASTGIPYSGENPVEDWRCNVDATLVLLEAMRARRSESDTPMVVLSSVKPYGLSSLQSTEVGDRYTLASGQGVDERFPLEPDEPYAASKAAQSMLCMAYARSYNLPVAVLRCSNLYGPAPCHGPRHGWLTWFCIAAVLGRTIEIQGSGRQTRDMLFTDDVVTAVLAAERHIGRIHGNVYNLGGGSASLISVTEAVAIISNHLERPVAVIKRGGRPHEDRLFVTDFSRFSAVTQWIPAVNVNDGIGRILTWVATHAKELEALYPR